MFENCGRASVCNNGVRCHGDCFVTPKIDGRESFFVAHVYGWSIILRDGTAHTVAWPTPRSMVSPTLLEGEVLPGNVFIAYDCLATPTMQYINQGRYQTRYAAMRAMVHRLQRLGVPCLCKPIFYATLNPHQAVENCRIWSRDSGLPCDGVIFIKDHTPGYGAIRRLWKVKHRPTIDFMVFQAFPNTYELMLRATRSLVQSLHRFSDGSTEYTLPVLLQPPLSLKDGDVVELSVRVHREKVGTARITFPTMQLRERGKQANCLLGGMDVAARGLSIESLLSNGSPHLVRILLSGMIRKSRSRFLQHILDRVDPVHILEIGGGRGGDMAQWIQFPRLEIVDVVEPDAEAVQEYQHRLLQTHRGMQHKGVVVLPNAQRFRFHGVPIFDLIPSVAKHRCNMAVLSFSISQIVSRDADADALLGGLLNSRNIPHIVIMAHDHTLVPLPENHGVRCTMCGDLFVERSPVAVQATHQEGIQ